MKYKKAIIIAIVLSEGILALIILKSDSEQTDHDGPGQVEDHDEHGHQTANAANSEDRLRDLEKIVECF